MTVLIGRTSRTTHGLTIPLWVLVISLAAVYPPVVSPRTEYAMTSVLTSADNGRAIDLRVGADVSVRLPDNPSTGYQWVVDSDARLVDVGEGKYVVMSNMVGGGGETDWSIKAKGPGTTTVKFKRWREWEGERSVVERYEITIRISP